MVSPTFNYERTARLIGEAVDQLHLDLTELTVYTEAATGGFAATAAAAVAAGAETVYALAVDSSYGSADAARSHTQELTRRVGDETTLVFPEQKRREEFTHTDIVTNTGFLRPLNKQIADWLGPTAAVPLMYEPWEFRRDDMNIEALWRNEVPVLGTDESDKRVVTQQYLRSLAVKVALDCNLEVYQGSFLVLGTGRMARHAARGLDDLGATVRRLEPNKPTTENDLLDALDTRETNRLDAVLVVDHETDQLLVGDGGCIDPQELSRRTRGATVGHICGPIAADDLDAADVPYRPESPASAGRMSYTTGYLGPRPIVDLHAAGLRVGADLTRAQRDGADFRTATADVAASSLGMDFQEQFKQSHGFYD